MSDVRDEGHDPQPAPTAGDGRDVGVELPVYTRSILPMIGRSRHGIMLSDAFAACWREALLSPDPSTQNGVILITQDGRTPWGCNTFTKGVEATPERLVRPLKYTFIEHAERNAIYRCLNHHHDPFDSVMVALWAACADCARAIVQSGVVEVVRHGWFSDQSPDRWKESIAIGDEILIAGGVKITRYDEPIRTDGRALRFCEQEVLPWG